MKRRIKPIYEGICNSFLPTLKVLLYPWLLILFLFPFVVGIFINPALIEYREIGISLSWLVLFQLIYFYTQKKFFYYLALILCFINGFINLVFWVTVQGPITASNLFVVFNTNMEEAMGFANAKTSASYWLLLPYLIFLFLAFRFPPKKQHSRGWTKWTTASVTGLAALLIIIINPWQGRVEKQPFPELVNATMAFRKEMRAYQNLKNSIKLVNGHITAHATKLPNQQVYILILGESTNRNHMSLYGYERNTNPLLSQFPSLVVYKDVVSGYTHTMESVPASLSEANLDNRLNPPESITLMEVMKAAGFHTYWLSNQSPIGIWDNVVTLLAEQADYTEFVNTTGSSSFETLLKESYDAKLFAPLSKALSDKGNKKFIVVHLMGTHLDYNMRYPPEFEKYKHSNPSWQTQWRDWYDNAVLYNDYVVDSMLQKIKNYCQKFDAASAVIYISDHGENVYDEGNHMGHDFSDTLSTTLVEIPFLAWTSNQYQKNFPEKDSLIRNNFDKPYMTDDLFYTLLDMSGISTPILDGKRSLFNPLFDAGRKRVLVNGEDYDSIKKQEIQSVNDK